MGEYGKLLECMGLLALLWFVSAVAFRLLGTPTKSRTERLCGYHLGSDNRRDNLAVLDSNNCEMCQMAKDTFDV